MEIDINQNKISIGEKYQIFVAGQQTHSASTKLFRWLAEIDLFENASNRPRYVIKKKWTFLNASFDLTRWDDNVLEFRTKSFWKHHYFCKVGQDLFEIFGHRGRKYSVYKNDKQIAWWDKRAVAWFNGDNYKIIADKDCDHELIISFCLMIDNTQSNDNDVNILTIDIGNIGPQAKKFDPTWQPKY
ncbi:hypothetical protein ACTJIJ_08090 [Niabella sp. 22666]|uniref:hypothetical protein n=1 Tax=Niabella sp. 22666 TaxID=3453954 RepID=UPI003F865CEA